EVFSIVLRTCAVFPEFFEKHGRLLCELVDLVCDRDEPEVASDYAELVFHLVRSPDLLDNCADLVFTLCQRWRFLTPCQIESIPKVLVRENPQFLLDVTLAADKEVRYLFASLPVDLCLENPLGVLGVVQRYGVHAEGLCAAFGETLLEQVQKHQSDIHHVISCLGDGASEFFKSVEPELWCAQISQLSWKRFSVATGQVYEHPKVKSLVHDLALRPILDRSTKEFNIRNYQRYLKHPEGMQLLHENILNLDPSYKPGRPLFLYGIASHDHNGSLARLLVERLLHLGSKARLLFFEIENKEDVAIQALRAVGMHGYDYGQPKQKNHAIFISAHSNNRLISFSSNSVRLCDSEDNNYLFSPDGEAHGFDQEYFAEIGATIEAEGYFGVMGCKPGKIKAGQLSLLERIHRQMGHVHVVGSSQVIASTPMSGSHNVFLDDVGQVASVDVSSGPESLVVLPAAGTMGPQWQFGDMG
ncbi:MAG: hypothetical protein KDD62_10140, partial [Bdellovibrionales bacterium]|nr:hypothetical protein [Bdellovibrionales bacterium]